MQTIHTRSLGLVKGISGKQNINNVGSMDELKRFCALRNKFESDGYKHDTTRGDHKPAEPQGVTGEPRPFIYVREASRLIFLSFLKR